MAGKASSASSVVVRGTRPGYRSTAIVVYADGTMHRGDVPLELATRVRNIGVAANAVGMSVEEFLAARDAERSK